LKENKGKPEQETGPDKAGNPARELLTILGVFGVVMLGIYGAISFLGARAPEPAPNVASGPGLPPPPPDRQPPAPPPSAPATASTNSLSKAYENIYDPSRKALYWWHELPAGLSSGSLDSGTASNIRPQDYTGARACIECHPSNHKDWQAHSHSSMNAWATPENVVGDFSGSANIEYLGGKGSFYREGDRFFMQLERDGQARVFAIDRTIGSRFTQYYIGRLIEGPDGGNPDMGTVQHVLPFGYWMDKQEWIPTVHVFRDTRKDDDEFDPFTGEDVVSYDNGCANCHTTLPAGDWMMRSVGLRRMSKFSPRSILFDVPGYLEDTKPEFLRVNFADDIPFDSVLDQVDHSFNNMDIPKHATELGISCEACHQGCQQHVSNSDSNETRLKPQFFPASPHLFSQGAGGLEQLGRSDDNLNFTCAKCHTGDRPQYAGGHDTWNSTEFSDAVAGACYDKRAGQSAHDGVRHLTCVHCHDPHKGIGKKWQRTPRQDDQSCIDCHKQFDKPESIAAHTRHAPGSEGSRCMNCHMPKINEGMQDMVRTHRIFSPTDKAMIEANQPNACNLCHLDKPIDWTIERLRDWYGPEHIYEESKLAANYPDREGAVGRGWLKSDHAPTRITAGWAMTQSKAAWALGDLLEGLNDDHLVNRQFLQSGLDAMLGITLKEKGYQFYMQEPARRAAIEQLKASQLPAPR